MVLPPYTSPLIIPSRDSHKNTKKVERLTPLPYKRMDMFHILFHYKEGRLPVATSATA
jgi:hypothetical protein